MKEKLTKIAQNLEMNQLPVDCICCILAFTSPKDVCRSEAVSSTFRSAANSDLLWKTFLPADYKEIIAKSSSSSSSSSSLNSLSYKALYFRLCAYPLLIGNGNLSFFLEKKSGKKCYMIEASDLDIMQQDIWYPDMSRMRVTIKGKIKAKKLSPKTKYAAYLVYTFRFKPYRNYLRPLHSKVYFQGSEVEEWKKVLLKDPRIAPRRKDESMEIEMGQIFNEFGDDNSIILFDLIDQNHHFPQAELLVKGIEIRPI